jgi:DNA-binding PadR family transcriptional regulator
MKVTYPTALVLQALARGNAHGFDIMDATDLPSGTVYPILRRLDREGLVSSRWEKQAEAQRAQRPPRRYYRLTAAGEALQAQVADRYLALDDVRRAAARARTS